MAGSLRDSIVCWLIMMKQKIWALLFVGTVTMWLLGACGPAVKRTSEATNRETQLPQQGRALSAGMQPASLAAGEKLRVVATTGIVGDVVKNVAGDAVGLTILMRPGQDPHTYQPTPQDIAAIEKAHIVFINGFGLEEGLTSTVEAAAGNRKPVVSVSDGIKPRAPDALQGASDLAQAHPATQSRAAGGEDPHVWFDPANVKTWVDNIEKSLSTLDPDHTGVYEANAAAYIKELDDLDTYIQAQVAKIPADRRKLVTDHDAFGYFADRYGFRIVGAVIPSISTSAEPSAGETAGLIEKVRAERVPAVFVATTANPKLADLVAKETGAQILSLYGGEMGPPGSGADSYIGMMRTDVDTIVKGLTAP